MSRLRLALNSLFRALGGRTRWGAGARARVRATAFASLVVLVASLAQVLPVPQSAQAAVADPGPKIPRRDLPLMTSTSKAKPRKQKPQAKPPKPPKQPKADFTPLARKAPAGKRSARAAGAPETSLVGPVDQAVVASETPVLKVRDVGLKFRTFHDRLMVGRCPE